MSSKIRNIGTAHHAKAEMAALTQENRHLKEANDMLAIMINVLVRRTDDKRLVLTPFEINAVLTDGLKDLKTSVDPTNQNVIVTVGEAPGRTTPLAASSLTPIRP